jgi:cytidylate kinase
MQITITGPRGGGSSTLAVEIAKFLESRGQRVVFRSKTRESEEALRDLADRAFEPLAMDTKAKVVIVEGMEDEDEHGITKR